MAEEERVVAEEVKNEPAPANPEGDKHTLVTFILSIVGFVLAWSWIVGGIAGIILGAIALKRCKNGPEPQRQPYITFRKVAKPVAIVDIIASAVMIVVYTILFIVWLVAEIAAATAQAANG